MFYTFDLSSFGNKLRRIRQVNGFSQSYVKETVGINEDTLRRIENGLVIPKYETLEILSSLYKTDLLSILQTYRRNEHFYDYYKRLDYIIANNDIHLLDKLIEEYSSSIKDPILTNSMISHIELRQFNKLLLGIKQFNSNMEKEAFDSFINAIGLTIENFNIHDFETFTFNLLEIRILFLIGILAQKIYDPLTSNKILCYVLTYLFESSYYDEDVQKIIIKCYCNISYNFHRINEDLSALTYADAGIDFCINNSNLYCLSLLYARKGAAEFFLHTTNYMDSLRKSIHLLQINRQSALADQYKSIFIEKYDFKTCDSMEDVH